MFIKNYTNIGKHESHGPKWKLFVPYDVMEQNVCHTNNVIIV